MKRSRHDAGVALIEALVALAIMSFGMLGVIGMQATLRFNAEAAKQRSEAVRLAQEEVERWRSFSVLDNAPPQLAFANIATTAAAAVALLGDSNTSFTRTTTVAALVAEPPPLVKTLVKTVTVTVNWTDRRNEPQAVTLTTTIAGIAPELAGSLGIPGDQSTTQRRVERHPAIPVGAVNQGNGTSYFTPPGGGAVFWRFNNATGQITATCNLATLVCTPINSWLLSGFVQFAAVPPTALDAETPVDANAIMPAFGLVGVTTTNPPNPCATAPSATFVTYYCLVPSNWSGRSEVTGSTAVLAAGVGGTSSAQYKVCRYTSVASNLLPVSNIEHPLVYANVNTSLSNQNFLVTRAGDGIVTPYSCPGDVPGNLVNSTTYQHQPDS